MEHHQKPLNATAHVVKGNAGRVHDSVHKSVQAITADGSNYMNTVRKRFKDETVNMPRGVSTSSINQACIVRIGLTLSLSP